MADEHINLVAVITPAPGKKDRVEEILQDLAKKVYETEPEVLRYQLHYQEDSGEFVFIERYANEAVFEHHKKQDAFLSMMKTAQDEDLFAKPLELKILKPIGGHEER